MRTLYTRADVEHLIHQWDSGYTLETAEARADLMRARATLSEPQRIALHYLCSGYAPVEFAKLMCLAPATARSLARTTLERLTDKMNRGEG